MFWRIPSDEEIPVTTDNGNRDLVWEPVANIRFAVAASERAATVMVESDPITATSSSVWAMQELRTAASA